MSFSTRFALRIAVNGCSGWITASVCVVGFLMSIVGSLEVRSPKLFLN
ncbi:hypothetical protein QUA81_14700 [Microcoleus sp. F6_B4]